MCQTPVKGRKMTLLDRIADWAITGVYGRLIHPRLKARGFQGCSHRLLHGGASCSGFARESLGEVGLVKTLPRMAKRFGECKKAALELNSKRAGVEALRMAAGSPQGQDWHRRAAFCEGVGCAMVLCS